MNEIPNTILKVDLTEARLQNPQTAADLLTTTGQVFVQKSLLGGSPMIRRLSNNRLLIVVNGVRMINAIYPAVSVQNAEVIFGHVTDLIKLPPHSIVYINKYHSFFPLEVKLYHKKHRE